MIDQPAIDRILEAVQDFGRNKVPGGKRPISFSVPPIRPAGTPANPVMSVNCKPNGQICRSGIFAG